MAKVQKITGSQTWRNHWTWQKTASGSNVQSTKSTCYRNLTCQNKAWKYSTKCIWQKSLTDHKPKRTRRYDGNHVNIASSVNRFRLSRKQSMAETVKWRHLGELDALTTKKFMTKKNTYSKMACLWNNPWQEKIHSMKRTTTTSLEKLNIMLTICQEYFIAKVEQD